MTWEIGLICSLGLDLDAIEVK